MTESETGAALKRAGRRALFHLVRAAVEGLKAVEAIVDELAHVGSDRPDPDDEGPRRVRIDIE